MAKLSHQERLDFCMTLKRFIRANPEIEDITGYSPGYYNRLINNFIQRGMPADADEQNSLFALIREVF